MKRARLKNISRESKQCEKLVTEVFLKVKVNKTCHPVQLKKLQQIYEKFNINHFFNHFLGCLMVPLAVEQINAEVENTLNFCANFAVSLYTCDEESPMEEVCPFLTRIFDFLFESHSNKDKGIRFRVCYFLNCILNSMGENAFLDDAIYDKITEHMTKRLLDTSPKVRTQAVFALHRLQDPENKECRVIQMFIYHLAKDPTAEVRRAVLKVMAKTQDTLQAVLKRTRDIDEVVRKLAYEFISKVNYSALSMKQREEVLYRGLKDSSKVVRTMVQNKLLTTWLRLLDGSYIKLMEKLDVEYGTKTVVLTLQTVFQSEDIKSLTDQLQLDPTRKLIPLEKLTSEMALYWRCLVQHFHKQSLSEQLEELLPELTYFCNYTKEFLVYTKNVHKQYQSQLTSKFILHQLLEIASVYDLGDEVGRENLKKMLLDILMSDYDTAEIINCIIRQLENIIPDNNDRFNVIFNVISDIRMVLKESTVVVPQLTVAQEKERDLKKARLQVKRVELEEDEYQATRNKDYVTAARIKDEIEKIEEAIKGLETSVPAPVVEEEEFEEKSDPITMKKCLTILCAMLEGHSVKEISPAVKHLLESIAFPCAYESVEDVQILALKAVGIACIFDRDLAKKSHLLFFMHFSIECKNKQIWVIALKTIIDLLVLYGLEYFEIDQYSEESNQVAEKRRNVKLYSRSMEETEMTTDSQVSTGGATNNNFIKIVMGLLDNENQELRTMATKGLCKLLLHRKIGGPGIISRLIILFHNPVNEEDHALRQRLFHFFTTFPMAVPESEEMFERAFIPTLQILAKAPETSPLAEISPENIASFILSLTKCYVQTNGCNSVHNNLAFVILTEILDPTSIIEWDVLLVSLRHLNIFIEDETAKRNLEEAVNKIIDKLKDEDQRLLPYIEKFKQRLQKASSPPENNTEVNAENSGEHTIESDTENEAGGS